MAKVGFRTSLFGFDKNDVMEYVHRSALEIATKEQAFKQQASALEEQIKAAETQVGGLTAKLAELEAELETFRGREAEIEKTSISIGTMYLVAKQNADEMIQTAEQYAAEVTAHAKRQLEIATKAGTELEQLKSGVGESAERFAAELSELSTALNASKERLAEQMAALEAPGADVSITDGSRTE